MLSGACYPSQPLIRRNPTPEGRKQVLASSRHRWFVVASFFAFMLLHQSDRLLISSLTPNIMSTFHITITQMGTISTGALNVDPLCYPLCRYLYERYDRANLDICVSTGILCAVFVPFVARSVPADIAILCGQLQEHAEYARLLAAGGRASTLAMPVMGSSGPQPA
jgi:hypothetical protein